jgi:hypothetical protein
MKSILAVTIGIAVAVLFGAAAAQGLPQIDPRKVQPTAPIQALPKMPVQVKPSCPANVRDCDGDGRAAIAHGGDDCDDLDARRFPGNAEVWDETNHDEDCDASTTGFVRSAQSLGPGVVAGSMYCLSARQVVIVTERPVIGNCESGEVCIHQPNGTGMCGAAPANYSARTPARDMKVDRFTTPQF